MNLPLQAEPVDVVVIGAGVVGLAVARALQDVRQGQSARAVLGGVEPALRAGVQALLMDVLRVLGTAEAVRAELAPRKPASAVDALLCTALALAAPEFS